MEDANCRLRHGLNIQCLAHIFQYLSCLDIYKIGEMNKFYKEIINDSVISKCEINFDHLSGAGITISQVFERYGTKIENIIFGDINEVHTIQELIQSIMQYCSIDQLKSVNFGCKFTDPSFQIHLNLPIQFQNVVSFSLYGMGRGAHLLTVELSKSLRHLSLEGIDLDPTFDWSKLKNLTELYLSEVRRIIVPNFIEFLRHRPNIKVFHHNRNVFNDSAQDVCKAMSEYCGKQIQDYSGEMLSIRDDDHEACMYDFVTGFSDLKKVCLTSHKFCGGDLIESIKRLVENDTIEHLKIIYSKYDNVRMGWNYPFLLQEIQDNEGHDMKPFSHLKSVEIAGSYPDIAREFFSIRGCDPFKILSIYASQILRNVEHLIITSNVQKINFIKYAPKLRYLELNNDMETPTEAAHILSMLESILKNRQTNGQFGDDIIQIYTNYDHIYNNLFAIMNGRTESIKLYLMSK